MLWERFVLCLSSGIAELALAALLVSVLFFEVYIRGFSLIRPALILVLSLLVNLVLRAWLMVLFCVDKFLSVVERFAIWLSDAVVRVLP